MNRFWRTAAISCIVLLASVCGFSTEVTSEVAANVPALSEFHDVIAPIWHQAWPNKDIAMLKKMVPDVEKGVEKIAKSKLPGILREKEKTWQENVAKFKTIAAEYQAAAKGSSDSRLLNAAEDLHKQYEALVRVVRPPLKELDEFHTVLYMLYHYEYPEYKLDKIKASVAALKEKMGPLNKASLPKRVSKKQAEFDASRVKLDGSIDALIATLAKPDKKTVGRAVETMHSNYQAVEAIFE
ncbi:MAG TPA: hypothetical protein VN622_16110 [Clostridia bacterium]|nr:hypothetical protein [Clostridia bacterium]